MSGHPYAFLTLFVVVALAFPRLLLGLARLRAGCFQFDKPDGVKNAIYECGLEATGNFRIRFTARSHCSLYAILFLIFDVEGVFPLPSPSRSLNCAARRDGRRDRGRGSAFYHVATFSVATAGAFGVMAVLERHGGYQQISDLAGLGARSPLLGGCIAVFILSLAGVPTLAGSLAYLPSSPSP